LSSQTRLRVAVAAVVAVGVVTPAAAGATQTHAPALAGQTTVVATRTSRIDVSLPKPVSLRYDKDGLALRGITVEGAGRYVGVSLASLRSQDGFAQLLIRPCFRAGCTASAAGGKPVLFGTAWSSQPVSYGASSGLPPATLPAGDYVLSVIADGSPVSVHLNLPGLTGRATYRTRLPEDASALSPAERTVAVAGAQPEAQSGGTGAVATSVQLLAQTHLASGSTHVDDESSWCVYDGSGPPGGVLTPGCPGAEQSLGFGATYLSASFGDEAFGMALTIGPASQSPPPATNYQGYLDYGVENITSVHDNFLWASLGAPKQ
jgi:hypothetical protein